MPSMSVSLVLNRILTSPVRIAVAAADESVSLTLPNRTRGELLAGGVVPQGSTAAARAAETAAAALDVLRKSFLKK